MYIVFSVLRPEGRVNLMTPCFHPAAEPKLRWDGSDISREKLAGVRMIQEPGRFLTARPVSVATCFCLTLSRLGSWQRVLWGI